MAQVFQFEQAIDILDKLSLTPGDEDAYELREAMESVILDHFPRAPDDAEAILNTLISNAEAGPRLDGRDLKALTNLKHWCGSLTQRDADNSTGVDSRPPSAA